MHTAILVIYNPEEQSLDDALLPFGDTERVSGTQYIEEFDITEERRAEYESSVDDMVCLADGTLVHPWEDACYRPATPEEATMISDPSSTTRFGYRVRDGEPRVYELPAGSSMCSVKTSDRISFLEWLEDLGAGQVVQPGERPDFDQAACYGYVRVDRDGNVLRVVERGNPNAHWDWWTLGGRWSGWLRVKANSECHVGSGTVEDDENGMPRCDAARAADIHWEYMHKQARRKAEEYWDAQFAKAEELERTLLSGGKTWAELLLEEPAERRQLFENGCRLCRVEPTVETFRRWTLSGGVFGIDLLSYPTRDRYVAAHEVPTLAAVVKNGEWHAKPEGSQYLAPDSDACRAWQERFQELLEDVPPDWMIAVVDCHY